MVVVGGVSNAVTLSSCQTEPAHGFSHTSQLGDGFDGRVWADAQTALISRPVGFDAKIKAKFLVYLQRS